MSAWTACARRWEGGEGSAPSRTVVDKCSGGDVAAHRTSQPDVAARRTAQTSPGAHAILSYSVLAGVARARKEVRRADEAGGLRQGQTGSDPGVRPTLKFAVTNGRYESPMRSRTQSCVEEIAKLPLSNQPFTQRLQFYRPGFCPP
jgi:hypothetical protein